MTRLTVRRFTEADFHDIEIADPVRMMRAGQDVATWARIHAGAGPSCTGTTPEGALVFCTGIHDFWHGTGEVWAVLSPLAKRYPDTLRAIRWMLEDSIVRYAYRRLQAVVDPRWWPAVRFAEYLGFRRECIMEQYGPNGFDMALYALIVRQGDG